VLGSSKENPIFSASKSVLACYWRGYGEKRKEWRRNDRGITEWRI